MGTTDGTSLQERVERLERSVKELQEAFDSIGSRSPTRTGGTPERWVMPGRADRVRRTRDGTAAAPSQEKPEGRPAGGKTDVETLGPAPAGSGFSESWLSRVGIALILFALAFLFKYSIDQGWLTPPVRVAFGLALGAGLLVLGARTHARRRPFSLVLSGGGIAALTISGFAAFQLFGLVTHPTAFAFMCAVTLLAFGLSLQQREATLSLIATVGGLGTPFLLYTGAGSLPGLMAYTCVLLTGTSAIYFVRGWRSLIWVSAIGAWCVVWIGLDGPRLSPLDNGSLQLGIGFGLLAFWALPTYRETLSAANPQRWSSPPVEFLVNAFSVHVRNAATRHVHLLTVTTPLIALAMSAMVWPLSVEASGWIAAAGAALFGAVARGLQRGHAVRGLACTHALTSLMLLTIAFCLLLRGDALFLTLVAEATVLHLVARRLSDPGVSVCGHVLYAAVAFWLAVRLVEDGSRTPVLNAQALSDLFAVAAAVGVSGFLRPREAVRVYRLLAHLGMLAWFWRELSPLPDGMAYVSIAWGGLAFVLLVLGLRLDLEQVRQVALGTLGLVVGKLFLIDLAKLEAIWRILLFLGFGGLFLALSYFYRTMMDAGNGRRET